MESGQLHEYKYWFELTHPNCIIRNLYFLFVPKVKIRQKGTETNGLEGVLFLFQFVHGFRENLIGQLALGDPALHGYGVLNGQVGGIHELDKASEVIFGGGRLTVHNKEIPLDYAAFCEVYEEANQKATRKYPEGWA